MIFNNKNSEFQKILLPYKKVFRSAAIFSAFINILMLVPSIYMLEVYDKVLTSRNETTLYMLSLIMLGLFILSGYIESIRSHSISAVGDNVEMNFNDRVFTATFKKNLQNMGSGNAQALNDLTTIRQFISSPALYAFFDFPWFPIYLIVIFMFSFWLGIYSIISILIVVSLALVNEVLTRDALKKSNIELIRSNVLATSNLRNSEVLAALGMINDVKNRWLSVHKKYLDTQRIAHYQTTNISTITKTVRMIMQSIALGLAALLVLNNQLLPGMMIASTILLGKALSPIEQIISGWKQMKNAKMAYARLCELLDSFPEEQNQMELPPPNGYVSVENLISAIPGQEVAVLKGVTFSLNRGDVLSVVGPSGAGKSNLARQLLGIWPLTSGSVRLDGAEIHKWDKNTLGKYIGYVPQDVELFPGTIAENISRFGDQNSEKIVEASKTAGIHELILRLPNGYNTVLGSDGSGLSGGQKQRIALARALYDNPTYIVMDEPNSNLDTAGELALVEAICAMKLKGATIVIISHRPSVLQSSNKMLVLNDGIVFAFGDTKEVLAKLNSVSQVSAGGAK